MQDCTGTGIAAGIGVCADTGMGIGAGTGASLEVCTGISKGQTTLTSTLSLRAHHGHTLAGLCLLWTGKLLPE